MNVDGQKATLALETGRIWRLLHGLVMLKLHLLIARVHTSYFSDTEVFRSYLFSKILWSSGQHFQWRVEILRLYIQE